MIVRPARFSDIPSIVDLCRKAQEASRYAAFANVQTEKLKETLFGMIAKHGGNDVGNTLALVAETDNGLDGVLIGICTWLYEITDCRMVTDVFWFTKPRASALAAKKMAADLEAWALSMPGPVVLRHGVTDAISDPERTRKMLERKGMRRVGYIYEKELHS